MAPDALQAAPRRTGAGQAHRLITTAYLRDQVSQEDEERARRLFEYRERRYQAFR